MINRSSADSVSVITNEGACDLNFLALLIAFYHKPGITTSQNLTFLANLLSKRMHKYPPFSWRYLHQLWHGKLTLPQKLRRAIVAEYRAINTDAPIMLESVTVFAPAGILAEGTLITAEQKYCVQCGQPYIPRSNNQKYCGLCRKGSRATHMIDDLKISTE